jgi:hypothetical protein
MKKLLLFVVAIVIAVPNVPAKGILGLFDKRTKAERIQAGKEKRAKQKATRKKVGNFLLDEFVTSLENQTGKNIKHHKRGTELQDLPKGYRPESRLDKLNKHYRNGGKPGTFDAKKEMKKERQRRARAERKQARSKK